MEKKTYEFWQFIQNRMFDRGIYSFRQLEQKANLSNGSISTRKKDLKLPTVEMAEAICHALDISWTELWLHAGMVNQIDPSALSGIDAEIYQILKETDEAFKQSVLTTIKTWQDNLSKNK